ncbi:unnamed protein product, partial [Nesidiocoris tenuis]
DSGTVIPGRTNKSARNCPILKCCAPLSTSDVEGPNCSDNDLLAGTPSGRRNDFTRKPRARPRGTTRVTAGEGTDTQNRKFNNRSRPQGLQLSLVLLTYLLIFPDVAFSHHRWTQSKDNNELGQQRKRFLRRIWTNFRLRAYLHSLKEFYQTGGQGSHHKITTASAGFFEIISEPGNISSTLIQVPVLWVRPFSENPPVKKYTSDYRWKPVPIRDPRDVCDRETGRKIPWPHHRY